MGRTVDLTEFDDSPSAWEGRGIRQDWPEGGTSQPRPIDDPAPVASEVANPKEEAQAEQDRPRRRTPADARQEAKDNALVLARGAYDLLEQSVDWADDPEGQAMLEHVAGWVRKRAQAAQPRNTGRTVYDFDREHPVVGKEG